jgi:hypothetical protein
MKRVVCGTVAIAAVMGAAAGSRAQEYLLSPSDRDAKAGYCFEVKILALEGIVALNKNPVITDALNDPANKAMADNAKRQMAAIYEDEKRLATFLALRLTQNIDGTPIALGEVRAKDDWAVAAQSPSATARIAACRDMNWLPF